MTDEDHTWRQRSRASRARARRSCKLRQLNRETISDKSSQKVSAQLDLLYNVTIQRTFEKRMPSSTANAVTKDEDDEAAAGDNVGGGDSAKHSSDL